MVRNLTVFILVFFLVGCINLNTEKLTNEQGETKAIEQKQTTEQDELERLTDQITVSEKEATNILLVGTDSRGEKSANSDSIIIVRYDKNNNSVKIASIMRDSYVKIPHYSKVYNKINHAYLLGGTDLLKETIHNNFGIEVDSVAVIDFQGFVNVINIIAPDGVEVEVTEPMIDNMKFDVKPGKRTLLGEDLLKYVRFRKDAHSDFGRVKRQQEVLILLKDEAIKRFSKLDGITKFPKLFTEITDNVTTDLSIDQIANLATTLIFNPIKDIKTIRIPIEDSFQNKSVDHAGAILQLDFKENIEALEQFFNDEEMVNKKN